MTFPTKLLGSPLVLLFYRSRFYRETKRAAMQQSR
jgi:hypothetical protein